MHYKEKKSKYGNISKYDEKRIIYAKFTRITKAKIQLNYRKRE